LPLLLLAGAAPVVDSGEISAFRVYHDCEELRDLNGELFIVAGSRAHPGDAGHAAVHADDAHGADADAHGDAHGADVDAHGAGAEAQRAAEADEPQAAVEVTRSVNADVHVASGHEAGSHDAAAVATEAPGGAHAGADGHHRRLNDIAVPGEHEHKHSPFYKAQRSGYYIHFDHVCSKHGKVEFGWLIDKELPPVNDSKGDLRGSTVSLNGHEVCQHYGQIQWFNHDGPPLGTTSWRLKCNGEFRDVPLTIRVEEHSEATTSECLPSQRPGIPIKGHSAIIADLRMIRLEWAWLRIETEPHRRLNHVHVDAEATTAAPQASNSGRLFPAKLYAEHGVVQRGSSFQSTEMTFQNEISARWLAAAFGHQGLYMVEIAIVMVGPTAFMRAVRARYLANVTRFRTRDHGAELSELFHSPGVLALGVGCPAEIQVDSLTYALHYRRNPGLDSEPASVYKGVVLFICSVLLLALITMKIVMCRRTLREARALVDAHAVAGSNDFTFSEDGAPNGPSLRQTAAQDSGHREMAPEATV